MFRATRSLFSRTAATRREVAIGVCVAVASVAAVWIFREPGFDFDLTVVEDDSDVLAFARFADDLEQIRAWSPWRTLSTEDRRDAEVWGSALDGVIRAMPESSLTDVDSLFRVANAEPPESSLSPGGDRLTPSAPLANADQVASYDAAVSLLVDRLDGDRLRGLRSLPASESVATLTRELEEAVEARRAAAYRRLAGKMPAAVLLSRSRAPSFPAATPSIRERFAGWLGHPPREEARWIDAFATAYRRDLSPLRAWLAELDGMDRIRLSERPDAGAEFRVRPTAVGRPEGGRSLEAAADGDVLLVLRGPLRSDVFPDAAAGVGSEDGIASGGRPEFEIDTGVRLEGFPIAPRDLVLAGSPVPAGPAAKRKALPDVFERFLRLAGLPERFRLEGVRVRPPADGAGVAEAVFRVAHRELGDCRWEGRLAIGPDGTAAVQALRAGCLLNASDRLNRFLATATEFGGVPATVRATGVPGVFDVRLLHPVAGPLRIELAVGADGSLAVSGDADGFDRKALVRRVCGVSDLLAPIAHLARLDGLRFDLASGTLSGRLAFPGPDLDPAAGATGIAWRAPPEGEPTAEPPGADDLPRLRGLAVRYAQLSRPVTDDPVVTAAQVAEYLRATYPRLGGAVELLDGTPTADGRLIRLRLRIADWPELVLGPVPVEPESLGRSIDELLSPSAVVAASARQWHGLRVGLALSHPRYGRIEARLSDWDARDGSARIACSLPLGWGDAKDGPELAGLLDWVEVRRATAGEWAGSLERDGRRADDLSAEAVSRLLDPARKAVEEHIATFLESQVGAGFLVGVDEDGFGPGRWLSLRPFGVKVFLALRVPRLPFEVSAGRMLVDADGIDLPEEYSATYFRTFPTPNCNFSDPAVTVNLAESALALACKVTPPFPSALTPADFGDPDAASSPELKEWLESLGLQGLPHVRLDNPWLNLAYVRGEFGGSLRSSRIEGDGRFVLLDGLRGRGVEAARGNVAVAFRGGKSKAEGYLKTDGRAAAVGLPVLTGRAEIDASGAALRGAFSVAGLDCDGDLRYVADEPARLVQFTGFGLIPLAGQVALHGESDGRFEQARLHGSGAVTGARVLGGGVLSYDVFASTADGFRVVYRWTQPDGGEASATFSAPSRLDLDEEEVRRVVQDRMGRPASPLTPAEDAAVARLPDLPRFDTVAESADPGSPEAESRDGGIRYNVPDLEWRPVAETESFRFFSKSDPKTDVLRVRETDLGFRPAKGAVPFALHRDDRRAELLVFDVEGLPLRLLRCERPDRVAEAVDLAAEARRVGPMEPALRPACRLAWIVYADRHFRDESPTFPRPVGRGVVMSYRIDGETVGVACWVVGGRAYGVRFRPEILPGLTEVDVVKALGAVTPATGRPSDLLAVEGDVVVFGRAAGTDRIVYERYAPQSSSGRVDARCRGGADVSRPESLALAKLVVGCMDLGEDAAAAVGPGGAGLLTPKGLSVARSEPGSAAFLPAATFEEWPADSRRHLPRWLDTIEKRREALRNRSPELLSDVVSDWNALRPASGDGGWGANPIGLVSALARGAADAPRAAEAPEPDSPGSEP